MGVDKMIKVQELRDLLNLSDKELKKLDVEQMRLLLGVFRYMTRVLEREINAREPEKSRFER